MTEDEEYFREGTRALLTTAAFPYTSRQICPPISIVSEALSSTTERLSMRGVRDRGAFSYHSRFVCHSQQSVVFLQPRDAPWGVRRLQQSRSGRLLWLLSNEWPYPKTVATLYSVRESLLSTTVDRYFVYRRAVSVAQLPFFSVRPPRRPNINAASIKKKNGAPPLYYGTIPVAICHRRCLFDRLHRHHAWDRKTIEECECNGA